MSSDKLVVNDGAGSYQTFSRNNGRPNPAQTSFRDSVGDIALSFRDSLQNSLSFGGSMVSVRDMGGQSSIPKSTANLIKNLVGAGVLALPAGLYVDIVCAIECLSTFSSSKLVIFCIQSILCKYTISCCQCDLLARGHGDCVWLFLSADCQDM